MVPELIALTRFGDAVHDDEIQIMAITLYSIRKPACMTPGKPDHPAFCSVSDNSSNEQPSLEVFINKRS